MRLIVIFLLFVMELGLSGNGKRKPGGKKKPGRGPPGGGPKTWCPKKPPRIGGPCICKEICKFNDECSCGEGGDVSIFECVEGYWIRGNTDVCADDGETYANECAMVCAEQEKNCDGSCPCVDAESSGE